MFHFDFTFPSILILLIFLYFFLSEPRLPVRKNRLFFLLVLVELLVLLFDILSSNADMNYQDLPIWLTAVLNMAYFVFFLARILLYFFYTLNILRRFPDVHSPAMLLYSSVFLISELLVLSSFRTGAVFLTCCSPSSSFSSNGKSFPGVIRFPSSAATSFFCAATSSAC